jgi:adenylate cyclase
VNLASRLEAVNKVYGTRILISEKTAAGAGAAFALREIDRLTVVGQSVAQTVYEVMARAGELSPQQATARSRYADGLAAYRARRWEEARSAFLVSLEAIPGDGPSRVLLERITYLEANQPAPDWDGSWRIEHK